MINPAIAPPLPNAAVIGDALRLHFSLTNPAGPQATIGVTRLFTITDLNTILTTFFGIAGVLQSPATRFVDDIPTLGPRIAAEARFQLQITFGPVYRNFDWRGLGKIGDNSRAAVLIHEATHIVDAVSGNDNIHISEFDPAYNGQFADQAMHNPSSYASFAAHIDLGSDPSPRFGLGPQSRGL